MPTRKSFDYALIRIVPRLDREEFLNAGIILFCLAEKFLQARVQLPAARLSALAPGLDQDSLERHLEAFPRICAADAAAGPIARLPLRERFHWAVAPRSTIIQISAVHTGLCEDPHAELDNLFLSLVSPDSPV